MRAAGLDDGCELRSFLIERGDDRVGELRLQALELFVPERGGFFEVDERADEGRMLAQSADRIILDRTLRLRAPQRVGGYLHVAERVFFDAVIGHCGRILSRCTSTRRRILPEGERGI